MPSETQNGVLRAMVNGTPLRDCKFDETERFSQVINHWEALRADGDMIPHRRQLNPVKIKAALPYIQIFELTGDGELFYRLTGTETVIIAGEDRVGKNVFDYVPAGMKDRLMYFYRCLGEHPCGGVSTYVNEMDSGVSITKRKLFLPLQCGNGTQCSIAVQEVLEAPAYLPPEDRIATSLTRYEDIEFLDIGAGVPVLPPEFHMDFPNSRER